VEALLEKFACCGVMDFSLASVVGTEVVVCSSRIVGEIVIVVHWSMVLVGLATKVSGAVGWESLVVCISIFVVVALIVVCVPVAGCTFDPVVVVARSNVVISTNVVVASISVGTIGTKDVVVVCFSVVVRAIVVVDS